MQSIPNMKPLSSEGEQMNVDFRSSFSGRNVFVTGHTGFKGSWLCLWLNRLGARVTGYSLQPPTNPSHFEIAGVNSLLERDHRGDIRDEQHLGAAMRDAHPDLVIHLASQSVVRTGYRNPRETFDVNVMGTVTVLDVIRALDRPCAVVSITSDKCYENREQRWGYREDDPFGNGDPYGGSKGAAEIAINSYRQSFFSPECIARHGIKLASARAGNVIGGGDWTQHALIVDIVKALSEDRPVDVQSPQTSLQFQHVLQALSGYLTLAARLLESDDPNLCSGWNIGPLPGSEISVGDVVSGFIEEWGSGSWRHVSNPNAPRELAVSRLAIDKALWDLPWRPSWDTRETLRRTAEWYRWNLSGERPMREASLEQIESYEHAVFGDIDIVPTFECAEPPLLTAVR